MNNTTREYINKVADLVRDYYQIRTPIEDMISVVEKIGGRICEENDFDNSYDGSIKKSGENSFLIRISRNQNEQRKNFTIAHELGHLFLHMGYRTNEEVWESQGEKEYRRFGTTEQEYQANEFAAALLMPVKEYKEVINELAENNRINMGKVANRFHASLSTAINRGRFLGIIA